MGYEDEYTNSRKRENAREEAQKALIFHWVKIGGSILLAIILLFNIFYIVNAGERGVLITLGNPSDIPTSEGLHVKIPFIQTVVIMDVKTQKYESELSAASLDLQEVTTKIAINYHLQPDSVSKVYREIGIDYTSRVIQPIESEANKEATAKFSAEQLITRRSEVRNMMVETLRNKLESRNIIVEDISIIDFKFSPSFTAAIENAQVQRQNSIAAENKLKQIEFEAKQRVTQAQGEAEAIKIQAQAIQAQGGREYVQLQAINKWSGTLPLVTGGSIPFINLELNNTR
jgi:regulator of protease activity HflC (stomatin/prohibitin superfamily)